MKKFFVFDTNVIMNNGNSIFKFGQENVVVIPFVVLHELDVHKTGNNDKNMQVRIFQRTLESLSRDQKGASLFREGIKLDFNGHVGGTIVVRNESFHKDLLGKLNPDKADHEIINNAYCLHKEGKSVILVSQDLNVLLLARSLGLTAQSASFEEVPEEILNYDGFVHISSEEDHALLHECENLHDKVLEFQKKYGIVENEYLLAGNDLFKFQDEFITPCPFREIFKVKPKNIGQRALIDALMDPNISIVTATGPAGTGKTLLGLASAFALVDEGRYKNILVSRREISTHDDHGFLPGTEQDKITPYMMPFVDNYNVIKNEFSNFSALDKITKKINNGKTNNEKNIYPFEIFSLNYLRGRTLPKSFIIIDEAQNLTPHQVRTIITRAGMGTKIFLTGHLHQVDDKYLSPQMNGLAYVIEKMRGSLLYAHVELSGVERSELAKEAALRLV